MRRSPLYSRSQPRASAAGRPTEPAPDADVPSAPAADRRSKAMAAVQGAYGRARRWQAGLLWLAVLGLSAMLYAGTPPPQTPLTQEDIDRAVMSTLGSHVLPSQDTRAYQAIIPSVVRVVSYAKEDKKPADTKKSARKAAPATPPPADGNRSAQRPDAEGPAKTPQAPGAEPKQARAVVPKGYEPRGVGTGVVIVDEGVILTNLHVVQGADLIHLTFMDGTESIASVTGVQAKDDLAVLRAYTVPDDLKAATLASTAGLGSGDHVMAVGFPFGIGPSASSGIVSGLKRSFQSPEGEQMMTNLIQFDAAANPGNSGGPLINMSGEVLGIVTAIYNPNEQRSFVGIGFAVPIENAAQAVGMSPF